MELGFHQNMQSVTTTKQIFWTQSKISLSLKEQKNNKKNQMDKKIIQSWAIILLKTLSQYIKTIENYKCDNQMFFKLIISAYRTDFSLVKADILSWNQQSYDNLLQLKVWPIGFWNSSRIGGRKHKFTNKKDSEKKWTVLAFILPKSQTKTTAQNKAVGRSCALFIHFNCIS